MEGAPTVTKRRFVDADLAKYFEVYFYREDRCWARPSARFVTGSIAISRATTSSSSPIFGNGFLTSAMIGILCDRARYLAVNTQVNSGNRGFHVIHRYARADFVSLNEPEVRLAAHNRHDTLESVATRVGDSVHAKNFAVTRGTKGVIMLDRPKGMVPTVPALSTKVVDRIGAGDAFPVARRPVPRRRAALGSGGLRRQCRGGVGCSDRV